MSGVSGRELCYSAGEGASKGKAPAGPAACEERRNWGWCRPSGAQGSQILGQVRRGISRAATLDLQGTDFGLLRSLADKSPLGDSLKGVQDIPQEGNPKGTGAEMWFRGRLGSVWLEDLKGLSQPKCFYDSVISSVFYNNCADCSYIIRSCIISSCSFTSLYSSILTSCFHKMILIQELPQVFFIQSMMSFYTSFWNDVLKFSFILFLFECKLFCISAM